MSTERLATLGKAAALFVTLGITNCSANGHSPSTSGSGGTTAPAADSGGSAGASSAGSGGTYGLGGSNTTSSAQEAGGNAGATKASAGTGGTTASSQVSSVTGDASVANPGLICSALASTDACDKCSNDQCCSELSACLSDTTCSSAADVWDSCWAGTGSTTACDDAFANAGYLARAWLGCLSAKCGPQCDSSDAGVGCKPDNASDPCDVCSSANCCVELNTCMLSTDCSKANDQWDACSQGPNASAACDTQFAGSGPEANAWYACLTKSCASQCGL